MSFLLLSHLCTGDIHSYSLHFFRRNYPFAQPFGYFFQKPLYIQAVVSITFKNQKDINYYAGSVIWK